MLAEAVERELTGRPVQSNGLKSIAKDTASSLASEVRSLLHAEVRGSARAAILIPVINLAAPFLWLAFSAWMLAISYADFRWVPGLRSSRDPARGSERRLLTLGFGGAVMVDMIPFLNLLMIPAAAAGATAMWVDELSQDGA